MNPELTSHLQDALNFLTPHYLEYPEPPVNREEALRYNGIPLRAIRNEENPLPKEVISTLDKAIVATQGNLTYRVEYLTGKLEFTAAGFPVLPFPQESKNLRKNLEGCSAFVMFAATIGSGMDRLIRRYDISDPAVGSMLQALGAERVESLCDAFNEDVRATMEAAGWVCHPRFSPGYGDLPLQVQPQFLELLDARKNLGITLNESLFMAPSKSVTAIIGLEQLLG